MSRDWQKDMELCQQLNDWYEHEWQAGQDEDSKIIRIYEIIPDEPCNFVAECENDMTSTYFMESRKALPYWLQQYAQLQSDFNYITTVKDSYKKRLEEWGNRALESEAREQKLREELEFDIGLLEAAGLRGRASRLTEVLATLYPKEEIEQ